MRDLHKGLVIINVRLYRTEDHGDAPLPELACGFNPARVVVYPADHHVARKIDPSLHSIVEVEVVTDESCSSDRLFDEPPDEPPFTSPQTVNGTVAPPSFHPARPIRTSPFTGKFAYISCRINTLPQTPAQPPPSPCYL
jgi:hypothetical protein